MLSRRQFFTISLIMLVLFFLFQVTGVLKEQWNQYDKNKYAETAHTDLSAEEKYRVSKDVRNLSPEYILLIGDEKKPGVGTMTKAWCEYTQRDLVCYPSLEEADWDSLPKPRFLVVDSGFVDYNKETEVLTDLSRQGISMIISGLPDVLSVSYNAPLRDLLGIYSIRQSEVELEGIELYDGFLLGGRTIYQAETKEEEEQQDLELKIPWYEVRSGTKSYMVGLVDKEPYGGEEELKNESLPAIIWRNSFSDFESDIFVVNGDYMETVTALGILSAALYETQDYALYPVVNAQNFVMANFAGLTSEEDAVMQQLYSRSQKAVFQDILWPSISSVFSMSGHKPTVFLSPKLDYESREEPDRDKLIYYMKLFNENEIENGLSLCQSSQGTLPHKLETDELFYRSVIKDYQFLSLYVDRDHEEDYQKIRDARVLQQVRTVFMADQDTEAPIGYLRKNVTLQRATTEGFVHNYSDNLQLKGLETCLGYSAILVDLGRIVMPEDLEEDVWEKRSEDLARFTITYWSPFSAFDMTTLSESDQRIRRFYGIRYDQRKKNDTILLNMDEFEEEAYFILRLHNQQVTGVEGGSAREIEDHAYLITCEKEQVKITLKEDIAPYYY